VLDWAALFNYLKTTPYHLFANYTLSVIPLFILMGSLAERGGLARDLFAAANALIGRRPGGMAMGVIGACAAFGAVCGSSVATTATFGRAALPELKRFGYDDGFATGTIAVGGTLGILIPPSVILVVYAISTEQNIAKLFMAAFIPGLLATLFYLLTIAVWMRLAARARPRGAPPWPGREGAAPAQRPARCWASPWWWWAASMAASSRRPRVPPSAASPCWRWAPAPHPAAGRAARRPAGHRRDHGDDLRHPARRRGVQRFLALTQAPDLLALWVTEQGFPPYGVLAALLLTYIVLGAVMDELAMILLTLPVFFPVVTALDFGLSSEETAIWFGILVLIVVGIGLTAPPIGLNVFVISAIARDVPIARTYRGVLPFLATDLLRLMLCVAFPGLSLWLVRLLT
jgi:TRAP-type C4-dicarboxylate transport system permease large subunit